MKINETLCVSEPADVLGQETGIFLLNAPSGEVQIVVCSQPGAWSVRDRQFFPESVRSDSAWRITKIAEETSPRTDGTTRSAADRTR